MLILSEIKGVGPATVQKLSKLGINTVFELFSFLPSKYIDLKSPVPVKDAEAGELNVFEGTVKHVSAVSPRGKRAFYVRFADCKDERIIFKATFYNLPYMRDSFKEGDRYRLLAKLDRDAAGFEMTNPTVERADRQSSRLTGVYTVYPLKGVLGQGAFKNIMAAAFDCVEQGTGGKFDKINDLMLSTLRRLHFPASIDEAEEQIGQLAAIDLAITLAIYKKLRKNPQKIKKVFYKSSNFRIDDFVKALPFAPTPSQINAFEQIEQGLKSDADLSAIVCGDVGSGKTAVAFFALCYAAAHGKQAALMAPTEILAAQHARSFERIAANLGVKYGLLTSSTPPSDKLMTLDMLESGALDVVIGTQALISEDVKYKNLALAVIDEQHKFGVGERRAIEAKGAEDIISLTATPIPRSMQLTFYEDIKVLDIKKRADAATNVKTFVCSSVEEPLLQIVERVKSGRQAFIVCPSIVDSEGYDVNSIESFVRNYGKMLDGTGYKVLHGKMPSAQKQEAMDGFARGEFGVLVATTVVEVGVDTLASDILILSADRFGLASLHQLRGRVGRDGRDGRCYLASSSSSEKALKRLQALCDNDDGQSLAEIDFEMRGAGDMLGTRQSGVSTTPIFGLKPTGEALQKAKRIAAEMLSDMSVRELLALTRRSQSKVEAFVEELGKVTLNS